MKACGQCGQRTQFYCYVHKRSVCDDCVIQAPASQKSTSQPFKPLCEKNCTVRTYLEWINDAAYDWPAKCAQCNHALPTLPNEQSEILRLPCHCLLHRHCAREHFLPILSDTTRPLLLRLAEVKCGSCNKWTYNAAHSRKSSLHSTLEVFLRGLAPDGADDGLRHSGRAPRPSPTPPPSAPPGLTRASSPPDDFVLVSKAGACVSPPSEPALAASLPTPIAHSDSLHKHGGMQRRTGQDAMADLEAGTQANTSSSFASSSSTSSSASSSSAKRKRKLFPGAPKRCRLDRVVLGVMGTAVAMSFLLYLLFSLHLLGFRMGPLKTASDGAPPLPPVLSPMIT